MLSPRVLKGYSGPRTQKATAGTQGDFSQPNSDTPFRSTQNGRTNLMTFHPGYQIIATCLIISLSTNIPRHEQFPYTYQYIPTFSNFLSSPFQITELQSLKQLRCTRIK